MSTSQYQSDQFSLELDKNVLRYIIAKNIKVEHQHLMRYLDSIQAIYDTLGRPFPTLSIVPGQVQFTSSARKYFRRYEEREMMVAHAIVIPNAAMLAMMKFILVLVPCKAFEIKLFYDEQEARNWLDEKIDSSHHAQMNTLEQKNLEELLNQGQFPERFQIDGTVKPISK